MDAARGSPRMSDETPDLDDAGTRLVEDCGLARAADVRSVRPLTGGVASDIAVVDLGDRNICIRFALPKLRVAADWRAPVHRNRAEYRWLAFAGSVVPDAFPASMAGQPATTASPWNTSAAPRSICGSPAMLAGNAPRGEAAQVGALTRSHSCGVDAAWFLTPTQFANRDDFRALRIEPYLLLYRRPPSRSRHRHHGALPRPSTPHQSPSCMATSAPRTSSSRAQGPVLLDAECATTGDPAFDVAFCLNHLVLKAVHLPRSVVPFWRRSSPSGRATRRP